MIEAVGFCPHPPVLIPVLSGAAAAELEPTRTACAVAIAALAPLDQIVLLGAGSSNRVHSPLARGSLRGFGADVELHLGSSACGGADELPLSLTVGAWLLRDIVGPDSHTIGFSVGADFARSRAAADLLGLVQQTRVGLLVLGDGSARRTLKAPGYLDDRSEAFDDSVHTALASGDPDRLANIDAGLGTAVLAAGVPAWHAAAGVLSGSYDARLLSAQAPYGVSYPVAVWTERA